MVKPDFFYLSEIARRWGVSESHLLRRGSEDKLTLHYAPRRMAMVLQLGARLVGEGMHGHHMDILNTGNILDIMNYGEKVIDAFYWVGPKKFSTTEYSPQGEELGPLIIRQTDVVITKEERDRFESKNGLASGEISKIVAESDYTADRLNFDPDPQALANNIAPTAEPEWTDLSPPEHSAEFALLCYQITNCLRRIPKREELARELVRLFGETHNITASNRSGESLIYDGKPYTHDALNKVIKRIIQKNKTS